MVHAFVMPALERLRQDDCKLLGRLGYTVGPCAKKPKNQKTFKHWVGWGCRLLA
jgi:hypothetical protein